ncbi:hypothetical protein [uncultured Bradyrhizobium sp.]|uniref:hypothetical protein n=1 Tax=uncultured Bradyrhizobium sp. TaxID=199684 RepID=UPI0035CBA6E6
MFTPKHLISPWAHAAALATVAALALPALAPSAAHARSLMPVGSVWAMSGTSGATDVSAARRIRGGYRGGGAAAAAAFAGIVGTGLAIAASRDRGYYGGPAYYDGGPAYYGGTPYDSYGYDGGPPAYYGGGGYGYRNSGVPYFRGHPNAGW